MANSVEEKKPNIFKRMGAWLKRSWSEFKKVSWPTFPEVIKNTGVVLLVVLLFTIVVSAMDAGLLGLFQLLVGTK
ncbi:MAG: preprotein translocase subunit SecE [Clostridia bacterium]